jgi:hypothetical protein
MFVVAVSEYRHHAHVDAKKIQNGVKMTDDLLFTLFQKGKTILLQRTANVNALNYIECVMRVIMADASGVLAQLAKSGTDDNRPVLFVPFDGTTTFGFVAPGFSQYAQLLPTSEVIDLESNTASTMGVFYAPYFEAPAPAPTPAPLPNQPQPSAPVVAADTSWLREWQSGTVFQVASTTNPGLGRYVGRIFQVTQADVNGVLALPERNSGLTEAVYVPFDGNTEFTLNPPGTFSFASGLGAGQQVYSPVTSSYVAVETFCPTYGYYYEPAPVVYFDTWVPTVGFGVVYDPYYVDPFWPLW